MEKVYTRLELFQILQESNATPVEEKLEFLVKKLCEISKCQGDGDISALKQCLKNFKKSFKIYWQSAQRKKDRFLAMYATWLEGTVAIPVFGSSSSEQLQKPFVELTERSKRRKTEILRKNFEADLLMHAAQTQLQTCGKRDASSLLKEIVSSPTRATRLKKAYKAVQENKVKQLTPLKALSIFVEADLSRKQYEIVRSGDKKVYPSYSILQREKSECYPPKESYEVTETYAQINPQYLLNHTASRLLTYLKDVLCDLSIEECNSLELISKWGCDGSQQAQFKQKMENNALDSHIFQSSFVPLRLIYGKKKIYYGKIQPHHHHDIVDLFASDLLKKLWM